MLTTKTLLLLIFVNIILIQMLFLVIHRISLNVSGTSIFLTLMNCFLPNILSLDLLQELHPACIVLIFCLSILKFILLPTRLLSLKLIFFMLSSADLTLGTLLVLVLFMIFSRDFGIQILMPCLTICTAVKMASSLLLT